MKLHSFAEKQKRLKSWTTFSQTEVHDESLRLKFVDTLKLYRNLMARCWEQEKITEEDVVELEDLERRLESLNEQARQTPGIRSR